MTTRVAKMTTNVIDWRRDERCAYQKSLQFSLGMPAALGEVMHDMTTLPFQPLLSLVLASLATLSGCGDAGMFARGDVSRISGSHFGAAVEGETVAVRYDSSRCDASDATCDKALAPAIEVHVEPRSIILDFSNVREPGRFENVAFEGYLVEMLQARKSPLLFAALDLETTTLDIDDARLAYDEEALEINLAGVPYDSGGFVKIDLLVGPLNPLRGGN